MQDCFRGAKCKVLKDKNEKKIERRTTMSKKNNKTTEFLSIFSLSIKSKNEKKPKEILAKK